GEVDGGGDGLRGAGAVAGLAKREEAEKPNGYLGGSNIASSSASRSPDADAATNRLPNADNNGDVGTGGDLTAGVPTGGVQPERRRGEEGADDGERGRASSSSRAVSAASPSPTFASSAGTAAAAGGGGGGGGSGGGSGSGRPERLPLDPTSVHPAFAGRRPLLKHESPRSGRAYGLWDPADVHPVYFGHLRHDGEASGAAGLPGWTGAGDGGVLDRGLRVLRGAIDARPSGAAG
ncbi:unnamed protein product, partial [Laminaria digitata]